MTTILVPYHQDDRLPADSIPVAADESIRVDFPAGDIWQRLVVLFDRVATAVATDIGGGAVPVVYSGDCLTALGTLTGAQRAGQDPAIVWFDAHGDVHTLETSTSGYLGGLSLRLALGAHPHLLAAPLGLRPLTEERAVLVDARDLDPAEADYLAGSRLRRCDVTEVGAALPDGPLLLHVDLDVIDSEDLPGLLFPVPGGPRRQAVLAAVRQVLATGRVVAVSVACPWHPAGDDRDVVTRTELLKQFSGTAEAVRPSREG